jgi:biopolymer transport protein TolQ
MPLNTLSTWAYAASEAVNSNGADEILKMVYHAGPMVKFVLFLLLILSGACWCVILIKMRLFRRVRKESEHFMDLFIERTNLSMLYKESHFFEESHLVRVFRTGYEELGRLSKSLEMKNPQEGKIQSEVWLESVQRAMEGSVLVELQRMERLLPLLATTGSTAPFIGLFGTVWGIMNSFREIGLKGAANLAVVAPGISEALVATAMGLGAAIPAVVAYNHFTNRIRILDNEMNHFMGDFLNMLKRDLIRRGK